VLVPGSPAKPRQAQQSPAKPSHAKPSHAQQSPTKPSKALLSNLTYPNFLIPLYTLPDLLLIRAFSPSSTENYINLATRLPLSFIDPGPATNDSGSLIQGLG